MIKVIVIGLSLLLASGAWSLPSAPLNRVVIDPGHGGSDNGAVYRDLKEKEITLQLARRLRQRLADRGWTAVLTRESDQFLSLSDRARLARDHQGDVLLSIHLNSSNDERAHGMEVYFENQLPPDEESAFLANRENDNYQGKSDLDWPLHPVPEAADLKGDTLSIVQDLQRSHRIYTSSVLATQLAESWQGQRRSTENTIRQAPFFVVSNVNMPSALIEVGFVTNSNEAQKIRSEHYQNSVVDGIVKALSQFKEKMDKRRSQSLK